MSTLTDVKLRKFEELLFSPDGGGSPDRSSGDACGTEEGTGSSSTESADSGGEETSSPAPDRSAGTGCVSG